MNAKKYGIRITNFSDFSSLYYHTIPRNLEFDYIKPKEMIYLFQRFDRELRDFEYVSPTKDKLGKRIITASLTKDR